MANPASIFTLLARTGPQAGKVKITLRTTLTAIVLGTLAVAGCSESGEYDAAYDRGENDGYALGYNSACGLSPPSIAADWQSQGYVDGYADGYKAGASACHSERDGQSENSEG